MGENQSDQTEQILRLTLEIILLLTGEEYFVVKKPRGKETKNILQTDVHITPHWSVIHNKKILELTRRMMELLTGEVPIRCQDVAVYFSMEEWEYVEGHKDLYLDIMEDPRPLTSQDLPIDGINEHPPPPGQYEGHSTNPNIYNSTDHIQQCPPPIKEEPASHNGRTLTQCAQENPISSIKEEPVSCNGGILPDTNIHRPTDAHTQQSSSYKEEPVSCNGGILPDTNIHRPTDVHTQHSSSYKEEPVSCNGGILPDTNIHRPTDVHRQQSSSYKEEPVSCNGRILPDTNIHRPTDVHTQHSSSYKEEPVSCNGRILPDTNIHRPTDVHTQQSSSYKEEPVLCNGGDDKDQRMAASDPTQQYLMGEQDGGTITTPIVCVSEDHVQCPLVQEEVVLYSGGNLISSTQPNPTNSAMEGTNLPGVNPPETQSQVPVLLNVQFSCSECKKCFVSMAELVSHQGVHMAEKLLQMRTHVFTTTIVQVAQVAPVKHKLLTCSTCGRTFYTKSSLVVHMKTHWGRVSKTFHCDYCGKSFPIKSLLNVHMRVHFGFRPYVCTLCGERFKRTCDLCKHQKKHQSVETSFVPPGLGTFYGAQVASGQSEKSRIDLN
ncbi:gastrula zinc finger protein XlCGF66.1-like [Hyla sarda]|uniref:gastrula zinc finger protein XlCGF66.1-like n=1 Tax=Hyla sarda TaxID=327740 RepID=UPI0024C21CF4|nr:gastrula zinc finger protein XlCGF66.1-like [Hyla sarda]